MVMTKTEDFMLKGEIISALALDPRVSASNVDVEVENGVATLTGTVVREEAVTAAEQLSRNIQGVTDVRNELKVMAGPRTTRQRRTTPPQGQVNRMLGENEMDLSEGYLEPPLHEENTILCPNCGSEFTAPSQPEVTCPECNERVRVNGGTVTEWGRFRNREE
jgi:DNA-directed RNA polymerase subunit RPC12/RpoP